MMFGHGDDLYNVGKSRVKYNFSSNVWFGASHDGLRRWLDERFDELMHYPEPDAGYLKSLLAARHGVRPENVLVTNGSISAFYLIAQTWASSRSAVMVPAFAEYEDACRLYNHRLRFFGSDEIVSGLDLSDCDLCWICNPNNPDGHYIEVERLLSLVKSFPQVIFIIDQVYMDFTDGESLSSSCVTRLPNLVLVRSVSKLCNIPGVRIGYIMSSEEMIRLLSRFQIPWSVNSFALEASVYILEHPEEFVLPRREWLAETDWLRQELSKIPGVVALPSSTSFFLLHLPGLSKNLKLFLLDHYAILVRDASNFRGLDEHYVRLSTQSHEANFLLLEGVRRWVSLNSSSF